MHLELTEQEVEYSKKIKERFIEFLYKTYADSKKKINYSDIERSTGVGRKNVKRILEDDRFFLEEEIDPICEYFGISKEQLDGSRFHNLFLQTEKQIKLNDNVNAYGTAREMLNCSILDVEKGYAHIMIGEVYVNMKKYKEAISHIGKGFEISSRINSADLKMKSIHVKLLYLFRTNQLSELRELAFNSLLDKSMENRLSHRAKLEHYLGIALYYLNLKYEAKRHYEESVTLYEAINSNDPSIARIKATIADMEYHEGNYANALSLLKDALKIQVNYDGEKSILTTKKDMIRCLLMLQYEEEALDVVEDCLQLISASEQNHQSIEGKVLLCKLEITKSLDLARQIIERNCFGAEVLSNAADFVVQLFFEGGDVSKEYVQNCYQIVKKCGEFTNFKRGVWY